MRRSSSDNGGRRRSSAAPVRRLVRQLDDIKSIDPEDYEFLKKFMTDQGKILPARLTGATASQQREIKRAIRRARIMGLLK